MAGDAHLGLDTQRHVSQHGRCLRLSITGRSAELRLGSTTSPYLLLAVTALWLELTLRVPGHPPGARGAGRAVNSSSAGSNSLPSKAPGRPLLALNGACRHRTDPCSDYRRAQARHIPALVAL